MKKITLAVIGLSILRDGGIAIITRPGKSNPSPNGVHQFTPAQAARLAARTVGFAGPMALVSLKDFIDLSAGSATLTMDAEECIAGQPWENKATGETGTYEKNWTKYSNHELVLGHSALVTKAQLSYQGAMNSAATSPVAAPAVRNNARLGVTEETQGTDNTAENTSGAPAADPVSGND